MALRIRKDIKKSSYYVWFLGAKESKGLRGKDFILPVIQNLVEREKDIEPFKVTLQVSHKGLKILQTVLSTNPKTSKPKNETIKHFIPHDTITCVYQEEDIVSCILLLFNPVTKCPLHVHVYRCDSVETATLLRTQLETLIDRPANQKKLSDLEVRIKTPKDKKIDSSLGSDTGTSTRESESSEERYPSGENRITTLYDSLAAELRQKLGKNESPILLPPRDYDTVHRQKGNLQGIELRRCLNTSIVGPNTKNGRRLESSGGSSGIGSDHAPSPDSPDSPERFNMLDNQSTSDEEWNAEGTDSTHYLLHGGTDMILPRATRHPEPAKFSPEPPKNPEYPRFNRYPSEELKYPEQQQRTDQKRDRPRRYDEEPVKPQEAWKNDPKRERQFERYEAETDKGQEGWKNEPKNGRHFGRYEEGHSKVEEAWKNDSKRERPYGRYEEEVIKPQEQWKNDPKLQRPHGRYEEDDDKPQEQWKAEKDAFYQRYHQNKFKYDQESSVSRRSVERYDEKKYRNNSKYTDDFEEDIEYREKKKDDIVPRPRTKYHQEDQRYYQTEGSERKTKEHADPKSRYFEMDRREKLRTKYSPEDPRFYSDFEPEKTADFYRPPNPRHHPEDTHIHESKTLDKNSKLKFNPEDPRYYSDSRHSDRSTRSKYSQESRSKYDEESFDDHCEHRRRPEERQRSPTPEGMVSPRDRFKGAKEKFLLLEKERLEEERTKRQEFHQSSPNLKDKTFLKRHESMVQPKDRFHEDRRFEIDPRFQPKPAPRKIIQDEEVRYRREVLLDRYRNSDERFDQNRRSMYSQIEDERKKNSNEIAKELKRRSYMEPNEPLEKYDLPDGRRYPGIERDAYSFSKSNVELDKVVDMEKYEQKNYANKNHQKYKQPAGYRHSYAEPKLALDKIVKKHYPEAIHRTNSSVSNSGRVGIASVNPY